MKYKSEIIAEILEKRGHEMSSLHYESECIDTWIEETKGAYPKLCDYESEWLNYINKNPIGEFPYVAITDVTETTINNVVPYAYKSAILSGKTLVNLLKPINNITIEANGTWITNNPKVINESMIKPSTTYTLITYVHNNTIADGNGYIVGVGGANQQSFLFSGNQVISPNQTGVFKLLMTTKSDTTLSRKLQQVMYNTSTQGSITFSQVLLEGDYTTADITYFEGMQSVKLPVLKVTGKNLFNAELEQGGLNSNNGAYIKTDTAIRTKDFIELSPNKTFSVSKTLGTKTFTILIYNNEKNFVRSIWDKTFTLKENERYIKITDGENNLENLYQIEEGSNITPYEPYKSNILTVNEDVTLRSNGDICDELNLLTGQLTQRIGEDGVVLSQEVVKTVDLTITNQDGETLTKLTPIEGTMHISTNGTPIKPSVSMEIPVEAITQNLSSFIEEE